MVRNDRLVYSRGVGGAVRSARRFSKSFRSGACKLISLWLAGLAIVVCASFSARCLAADTDDNHEARLLSVAPLSVQRGQAVQFTLRGRGLENANAAWFEERGLHAEILDVKPSDVEVQLKSKNNTKDAARPQVFVVQMRLTVDSAVAPGEHALRVITPRGLSAPIAFWVTQGPTVAKSPGSHGTLNEAQAVTVPSTINGEISQHGELDYYSFQGQRNDEVRVDVERTENFAATLALYEPGGSWFDPNRPTRLLSREEKQSDLIPTQTESTYVLPHDGTYFVEVSGLYGEGCTGCEYVVRVSPGHATAAQQEAGFATRSLTGWVERGFSRPLDPTWLAALSDRSLPRAPNPSPQAVAVVPAGDGAQAAARIAKAEIPTEISTRAVSKYSYLPEKSPAEPQMIQIPGLVEGVLDQPGEIQSYRFTASKGQKLAFELETPEAKPPHFNPRIGIIDAQDKEVLSNAHRSVSLFNANGDRHVYLKAMDPKVVYTFEHAGTYVLQVRDITSHYAGPTYRYRVMIRPQDPHVGEIIVAEGPANQNTAGETQITKIDHLNLTPGKTHKLDILASYEEGFAGDVYFNIKGLPEGVEFLPGTENGISRPPVDIDEQPEQVAPEVKRSTLVLLVDANAPPTPKPVIAHVTCRPIVNGAPGKEIEVKQIPVMVLTPSQPEVASSSAKSGK